MSAADHMHAEVERAERVLHGLLVQQARILEQQGRNTRQIAEWTLRVEELRDRYRVALVTGGKAVAA